MEILCTSYISRFPRPPRLILARVADYPLRPTARKVSFQVCESRKRQSPDVIETEQKLRKSILLKLKRLSLPRATSSDDHDLTSPRLSRYVGVETGVIPRKKPLASWPATPLDRCLPDKSASSPVRGLHAAQTLSATLSVGVSRSKLPSPALLARPLLHVFSQSSATDLQTLPRYFTTARPPRTFFARLPRSTYESPFWARVQPAHFHRRPS